MNSNIPDRVKKDARLHGNSPAGFERKDTDLPVKPVGKQVTGRFISGNGRTKQTGSETGMQDLTIMIREDDF